MTISVRRGGAWLAAAPLASLLAITAAGCSSAGSSAAPAGASSSASPTSTSAATVDPAARRALADATRTMTRTRTYAFVADSVLQAKQTVHSHVAGRVVHGSGLAYRLTVARRTTQVVRTQRATYVRKVPGHWSRLAHPHAIVNPTTTLLAVLHGLTPTGLVNTRTIAGRLDPAAAEAAQLPSAEAATVLVHLDPAGHVTSLLIRAHAQVGVRTVGVLVRTTYSHFGHVPAVRRPV